MTAEGAPWPFCWRYSTGSVSAVFSRRHLHFRYRSLFCDIWTVMFLRSLPAFLVLPGIAAFVLPPVLAAVDHWRSAVWRQGTIVMVVGLVFLLWCVRDFYVAGKGTLAPWDPPKHLVLVGLSRYVRNPMYMGVLTLLAGWTIFFASPLLAIYTVALAAGFHIRVRLHEEPMLRSRFGDQWERYCASVARWAPRLKAWRSASGRIGEMG